LELISVIVRFITSFRISHLQKKKFGIAYMEIEEV
jgi:hypothetical protein